jgi:hypothetical protein
MMFALNAASGATMASHAVGVCSARGMALTVYVPMRIPFSGAEY